jgi:hypothetical protein
MRHAESTRYPQALLSETRAGHRWYIASTRRAKRPSGTALTVASRYRSSSWEFDRPLSRNALGPNAPINGPESFVRGVNRLCVNIMDALRGPDSMHYIALSANFQTTRLRSSLVPLFVGID